MTIREFFNAVIEGNYNDELTAKATEELAKMDAANAKRKEKAATGESKKAQENAPIIAALTAALTNDFQTAGDLAAVVGISTQKASSLLRQIVAAGNAVSEDIKVAKKGTCKGYRLPTEG